MNAITRSRNALALLTAALGFYALGTVFGVVAYATFSGDSLSSYNTFRDLGHASDWLHFVGALMAFGAVATTLWETMAARLVEQQAELAAAGVATLLIAVGALILAASDTSASTANIVGAIGIGVWALLVLVRAARLNLAAQQAPGVGSPEAGLWLAASVGVLLFAVGSGFNVGPTDQGLGIAVGILQALGFGLLAWALLSARTRGLLVGLPTGLVIQGLGVLAAASVVAAIVAGLVFTPHGTLTGLRIGVSITYTVQLFGVVILSWAAWRRLGEVVSGRPAVARARRSGWSWARPAGPDTATQTPPTYGGAAEPWVAPEPTEPFSTPAEEPSAAPAAPTQQLAAPHADTPGAEAAPTEAFDAPVGEGPETETEQPKGFMPQADEAPPPPQEPPPA